MTTTCQNCDAPLNDRYCEACGQKRLEPEERRLSWFVGQFVRAATMADRRFFGSIVALFFTPGRLDRDWLQGRRRRHLAPLTLFLIANLVYFFHPTLSDMNLSLTEQYHQQPYSQLVEWMVDQRLADRGESLESYAAAYRSEATHVAKLLVILHAPFFAVFLMLVHARTRLYFVDHLAVALHFWALQIVLIMAAPLLLRGLVPWAFVQALMFGLVAIYLWRQIIVAYAQPWWHALLKLPVLAVGLIIAHFLYRLVHFLIAFAMS